MDNKQETWREIPGFPGYEASDWGRVRSFKKRVGSAGGWKIADEPQRVLSQGVRGYRNNHPFVMLCREGRPTVLFVSRLIMLAFEGEPPEGMLVHHLDGDAANNRLENLRYDSREEIARQAARRGRYGKMSEAEVVEMRERYATGEDVETLARNYGICVNSVYRTCTGRGYVAAGGPITRRQVKTTPEQVKEIRRRYAAGELQKDLAVEFGVHFTTVSRYCARNRRAGA